MISNNIASVARTSNDVVECIWVQLELMLEPVITSTNAATALKLESFLRETNENYFSLKNGDDELFLGETNENYFSLKNGGDESFLGETNENYFSLKNGSDEQFLGETSERHISLKNGSDEQFLGETNGNHFSLKNGSDEQFLGETSERHISLKNGSDEQFLGETNGNHISLKNGSDEQFLGETNENHISLKKKKKSASGSIAPFIENKKLKDGFVVSYPRVDGERDRNNLLHWRWGYYYEIKVDGIWKNRSISVPVKIVPTLMQMVNNKCTVEEIKNFILDTKMSSKMRE